MFVKVKRGCSTRRRTAAAQHASKHKQPSGHQEERKEVKLGPGLKDHRRSRMSLPCVLFHTLHCVLELDPANFAGRKLYKVIAQTLNTAKRGKDLSSEQFGCSLQGPEAAISKETRNYASTHKVRSTCTRYLMCDPRPASGENLDL